MHDQLYVCALRCKLLRKPSVVKRNWTCGASGRRNHPLFVSLVLHSTHQRISYASAPEVLDSSTCPPQKRQRRNPSSDRSTYHQSTSEDPGCPLMDHDVLSIVKTVLDTLPSTSTGTGSSHNNFRHTPNSQAEVSRKLLNCMLAILLTSCMDRS